MVYISVKFTFIVETDWTWKCFVLNKLIDNSSEVLKNLPSHVADNNVSEFVATFSSVNISGDNEDFGEVLSRRIDFKEPFPSQDGLHSITV